MNKRNWSKHYHLTRQPWDVYVNIPPSSGHEWPARRCVWTLADLKKKNKEEEEEKENQYAVMNSCLIKLN